MESKLIPGQCVEVVHSCVKELTTTLGDRPTNADQVNKDTVDMLTSRFFLHRAGGRGHPNLQSL